MVQQKTLESLWNCKETNQSILKETNAEYSLEGLMLKLQYFGHLMRTANSLKKTDILGKIEGKRRREWQRIRCLDIITNSVDMNLTWGRSRTWLSNWAAARHYSNCWQNRQNLILLFSKGSFKYLWITKWSKKISAPRRFPYHWNFLSFLGRTHLMHSDIAYHIPDAWQDWIFW